jgi:hypothetical protein
VSFDYEGCRNEAGIEFESLVPSMHGLIRPEAPPSFEVLDETGRAVASGSFDYG